MSTSAAEVSGGRVIGRDRELFRLGDLLSGIAAGRSALVALSGLPGTGRTALAGYAVTRARGLGVSGVIAACSPAETEVRHSAVTRLLAAPGAPPRFRTLVDEFFTGSGEATVELLCDAVMDVVRGRPTVLALDDLHWADSWSLAWWDAMIRRMRDAPLVLVSTSDDRLSRTLPGHRENEADRGVPVHEFALEPFDRAKTCELLERQLGRPVTETFGRRAHAAARGLPAVLDEATRRFTESGRSLEAGSAAEFASIAKTVAVEHDVRSVRGLSPDSLALLRALCVCGESLGSDIAPALAELGDEDLPSALAVLVASGLISATGDRPGVVNPRLAAEVLDATDPATREKLYLRAAELGHLAGADAEAVASLLLRVRPVGAPWVAAALIDAARPRPRQAGRGLAVEALCRVLAEPLGPDDRARVLIRLAALEVSYAPEASDGRLLQVLTSPELRSLPSVVIAADLLLARGDAESVRQAAAELSSPRESGDSLTGGSLPHETALRLSAIGRLAQAEAKSVPELPLAQLPKPTAALSQAGALAWELAVRAENRDLVQELATKALSARDGAPLMPRLAACRALLCGIDVARARTELTAIIADAREAEARPVAAQALMYRAASAIGHGRVDEAVQDLLLARQELPFDSWHPSLVPRLVAGELIAQLRLGRLSEARRLASMPLPNGADRGAGWAFLLFARAELWLFAGAPDRALAALRECGRLMRSRRWNNPTMVPWRTMTGIALRDLGEPDAAEAMFGEDIAIARRWGTARQLEKFRDRMVADLAMDIPARVARPHRPEVKPRLPWRPAGELSPAERDLVALVVQGAANREIADGLSVAVRTVELRLTKIYRKLGVKGRAGLVKWWTELGTHG